MRIDNIPQIIPGITVLEDAIQGGQKKIFHCTKDDQDFALLFISVEVDAQEEYSLTDLLEEEVERAKREVAILSKCVSPYLVKLGPIELSICRYNGEVIVFFSEEWIDGENLKDKLRQEGCFKINDVIKLGKQMSMAVDELWQNHKVHRDIKPANIIQRENGDFVLLDMGLAFDLEDKSLTAIGFVPGTKTYLSPDQLNTVLDGKKRQLDFRSDLFSIGVVMYECFTGSHPFYQPPMNWNVLSDRILNHHPPLPSTMREQITVLDEVIERLLNKKPHLRYRTCEQLTNRLDQIE